MPTPARPQFWRHPELPFLEGRRATGSLSCYAAHSHPSFSIGIIDAGRSVFSLDAQQHAIGPGDVVLVRAGEVHCCNPEQLSAWSYRMFHLDCAWLDNLRKQSGITGHVASQVLRQPQAVTLLDRMTAALDRGGDIQDEVVACLRQLMRLCVVDTPPYLAVPAEPSEGLRRAYRYLQAHCLERVGLGTLAQVAGIDRYQLIRQFRRHYGMTPHALQLDMKINQARTLLRRGASAAEAAYDTGFADQSHFQRAFKARVAATPAQYRR